jgi:hypothetical protein
MNVETKILSDSLAQLVGAVERVADCIDWEKGGESLRADLDMAMEEAKDVLGRGNGCESGECAFR